MPDAPKPTPVARDTGRPSDDLIEQLCRVAPEAFTEGRLDIEALTVQLGGAVEHEDERYRFGWHGRAAAVQQALLASRATLVPADDLPGHDATAENVFIEGDNLEILKVLRKSYAERFKLIYIDPPYTRARTSSTRTTARTHSARIFVPRARRMGREPCSSQIRSERSASIQRGSR